jgi:transposase
VAVIICGVDIGAKTLDARIGRDGAWQQFKRSEAGIAELVAFCKHHEVGLVVMEATGGYERLPFGLLWTAGLPVAIVTLARCAASPRRWESSRKPTASIAA